MYIISIENKYLHQRNWSNDSLVFNSKQESLIDSYLVTDMKDATKFHPEDLTSDLLYRITKITGYGPMIIDTE